MKKSSLIGGFTVRFNENSGVANYFLEPPCILNTMSPKLRKILRKLRHRPNMCVMSSI